MSASATRSSYIACLVTGLFVHGCSDTGADTPSDVTVAESSLTRATTPSSAHIDDLGASNRGFAFDLYHQLAEQSAGANLVFSPYSVATALAMTYAGARTQTESEMATALHFELAQPALHETFNAVDQALATRGMSQLGADGTPFRLMVNNGLWQQRNYRVHESFLDVLQVNYGSPVYLTDFASNPEASRGVINRWVSQQTEQLIPALLPPGAITAQTRLVLTNTVYFNASWLKQFEPARTQDATFHPLAAADVTTPFMSASIFTPYAAGTDYEAVSLRYASADLSFIAILPTEGRYEAVEAALSEGFFQELNASWASGSVNVALPKLDYKAHTSLKPALQALGMQRAFSAEADFSGMTDERVAIDDVIHEASLKVTEGGTIAAAATAVIVKGHDAQQQVHTLRLDRPFIFAIVDQPTGAVLFLGRVLDPSLH